MTESKTIKKIAIYLRKSRGDKDEDILVKHRIKLTNYAKQNEWSYDIFEEDILSGENLSGRPAMLQLLDCIEEGQYDGVLVNEYQRLSRGDQKDFGEIIRAFRYKNTLLITPERIFDTNDANDLTHLGILQVFSNSELNTIKKHFSEGKKNGALLGKWTNGKPPYPYEYVKKVIIDNNGKEKVIGQIIVNEDKKIVYLRIKEMYLSGKMGTQAIAYQLNREKMPSPNGSTWHNNAVKRLLVHEFHLGKVIFGRNEWKRRRDNKRMVTRHRDESEWSIGEGEHQRLKTHEEHERILELLEKNQKIPHKSRAGCFPTSGLLYCKKCGHRMSYSIGRTEAKRQKVYNYTKCSYHEPDGKKCPQKGIKMDEFFYEALYDAIVNEYLNKDRLAKIQEDLAYNTKLEKEIKQKRDTILKAEKALIRIKEGYEAEVYTLKEFAESKEAQNKKIELLKKEIQKLESSPAIPIGLLPNELEKRIAEFKVQWKNGVSPKEINTLIKSIIKKIYYDRTDNEVTLEIEYF